MSILRWSPGFRSLALTAVAGLAATLGACHSARPMVEMWVPEASSRITGEAGSRGLEAAVSRSAHRVKLAGAINETLSFRFALRASGGPIEEPGFRIDSLLSSEGRIGPSALRLFRMHPVPIREWPGWHVRAIPPGEREPRPLDVLVPFSALRGGLPAVLLPEETYHFWVDVAVPKGTPEGIYTTAIGLTSRHTKIGQLDVELTVWPFILPEETEVPFIAELDHRALFDHHLRYRGGYPRRSYDDWRAHPRNSELDNLLQSAMRLLQGHRLSPVLPQLMPLVAVGARDEVIVDWNQYDAVVEPYLDGRAFFNRVPLPVWPLPIQAVLRPEVCSEAAAPSRTRLVRAYLAACAEHFASKGWLGRSYAALPMRFPPSEQSSTAWRGLAETIRQADPPISILARMCPHDLAPLGWVGYSAPSLGTLVDIWMPPAQFYDGEVMAAQRARERRTWVSLDRPPFSGSVAIHAPPQHVRILGRQAETLQAEAMSLGCVNHWPDAAANPTPDDCVEADPNVLLYPGGTFGLDEPIPSVRLKLLRRARQDAAYDKLLFEHGLGHIARTLRESLSPYAGAAASRTHYADGRACGWVDDPTLFEVARHIAARELVAAVGAQPPRSQAELVKNTVAWRRLMLGTRKLRVHFDGAHVRVRGSPGSPIAEVECTLTLSNQARVPFAGGIRFTDLPEGWQAAVPEQPVREISPSRARQVRIMANAPAIPGAPAGHVTLPIQITGDDGTVRRFEGRLSCIAARTTEAPPAIDGDLSDWPPGMTNVAADFALIAGNPGGQGGADAARPRCATIGFVLRDAHYLYLGINCETVLGAPAPPWQRKSVRYEDQVPQGEELVEVLIDPYNAGTRSPSDLFHIVVKKSGADLTERGVRFPTPCGAREPWAADLDVATRSADGRWTVELRIPMTAFGGGFPEQSVWGFNITRFDLAHQEFSTWSGAIRNAYDPLSLGNLYFP